MVRLGGKAAIAWITCAAFVFGSVPVMAAPVASHDAANEVAASPAPQGVKGRTVAKAVVLVAKGIRVGNKHFGKLAQALKGPAATAFLSHSGKIADLLDDIAKIPDLVSHVVREKLFFALSNTQGAFKIEPGLAKDIADEIVAVVNALL